MATQRIGNNRITDGEVTGPKLGLNSIGANNFTSAANTYITAATPTDATQNTNITTAQNSAAAAFTRANNSLNANTGGTIGGATSVSGNLTVVGDTSITGNLYVTGNTVSISAGSLVANDSLIVLALNNYVADIVDIGFTGHYNDGVNAHTGFIRDSGTKEWHLFKGYTPEMGGTNNVDINDATFGTDTLNANIKAPLVTANATQVRGNLNIQTITETANIYSTAIGGNVILALANNSTYYFSAGQQSANITFDLRANNQSGGGLDNYLTTGQMISVGVMINQGPTAYRANLYIDGVLQTANTRWSGNVNPANGGTVNGIDVYSFSVLKTGANSYIILASNTAFANGATSAY